MAIPGKGHKDIGQDKKNDGFHGGVITLRESLKAVLGPQGGSKQLPGTKIGGGGGNPTRAFALTGESPPVYPVEHTGKLPFSRTLSRGFDSTI